MSKNKVEKKLNLVPTSGYLIIEPVVVEEKTAGGIYLPDNASSDKPQQGTVLAVGPDEITDNGVKKSSPAKVGQKVVYKKWGGNEVKIDGKEYLFVKFEDVLAVIAD
ncbi:MAG: co-chaperone GroES [Patescibacteria group bacterium]|nr:co-chaperone GroES [Patescibacteria group bacterium]